MGEVIAAVIVGLLGFVIGGVYGLNTTGLWSPACWWGLLVALGVAVVVIGGCNAADD